MTDSALTMPMVSRAALIRETRTRLLSESVPRLTMSVNWARAVIRHTWQPALAVIVLTAAAGYALQLAAPEARSIGGVIRSIAGE
jgi:hypothetical protein